MIMLGMMLGFLGSVLLIFAWGSPVLMGRTNQELNALTDTLDREDKKTSRVTSLHPRKTRTTSSASAYLRFGPGS